MALGNVYETTETTYRDAGGNITSTQKTKKKIKPDRPSIIFALTNRASDRWRFKQDITIEKEAEKVQKSFEEVLREQLENINEEQEG